MSSIKKGRYAHQIAGVNFDSGSDELRVRAACRFGAIY